MYVYKSESTGNDSKKVNDFLHEKNKNTNVYEGVEATVGAKWALNYY